ncbi:LacI family DNA-binding transcriptional regulator [Macrococcus equi]|uniref:LacI family DNA-binding transcriptional regulator n=1 Tax=Macrococcus equi TaxID=3395462 RepID=UPI0039BDD86E
MNILDVAKACNVSKSTVSRVINNQPHVSEATRKKVIDYINKHQYVPNNIANYFRNKTTKSIAISIPNIDHPFFSKISSLLSSNLNQYGYKTYIHQTFANKNSELEILNALKTNEIDAVILCSIENEHYIIEEYSNNGLIIVCNDAIKSENIATFHFDEENVGYLAGKYLLKRNKKTLGICIDNISNAAQQARLKGFKKALYERDIELDERYIFTEAYSIKDGLKIGNHIMKFHKQLDGLYTGNDYVSAGVQSILDQDIDIIGTDNQSICLVISPRLDSIIIPIDQMAKDAVEFMVNKLNDKSLAPIHKLYQGNIIENKPKITP